MCTLTIALIAAVVVLLSQQLTAADDDRRDREERGNSQAVIGGSINCVTLPEVRFVGVNTFGGLGILATLNPTGEFRSFGFSIQHAQDCSDLMPALAELVPRRICEIGSSVEEGNEVRVEFVCTGRVDAVISAVGKMARAVARLGQT